MLRWMLSSPVAAAGAAAPACCGRVACGGVTTGSDVPAGAPALEACAEGTAEPGRPPWATGGASADPADPLWAAGGTATEFPCADPGVATAWSVSVPTACTVSGAVTTQLPCASFDDGWELRSPEAKPRAATPSRVSVEKAATAAVGATTRTRSTFGSRTCSLSFSTMVTAPGVWIPTVRVLHRPLGLAP